jgi:hypothetical protein
LVIASGRHLLGTAAILVILFAGSLRLFEFLWHRDALADITRQPGGWPGAIAIVAASAVLHELLHAFGLRAFARVPWRSITLRPTWRGLGFVARPNVPVPSPAYRGSIALPAVILGVVPIVLGLLMGGGLFVLWGLFFSLECFTDVAVLLATRKASSRVWVLDHPDKLGCRMVVRDEITGRARESTE